VTQAQTQKHCAAAVLLLAVDLGNCWQLAKLATPAAGAGKSKKQSKKSRQQCQQSLRPEALPSALSQQLNESW
jgi:hypothetical protein